MATGDQGIKGIDELGEQLERAISETGERMLPFFRFKHLPEKLQATSAIYARAAVDTCMDVGGSAERTVALRKLLEGKDAAVRAKLEQAG